MTEQQLTHRSRSLLNIGSIDDAIRAAEILAKSGLVPDKFKGKPADVLVAMQWGAELGGVQPLQALNGIAVVNGTPSIYGDLGKALILRQADLADLVLETRGEGRDMEAICNIERVKPHGKISVERTFSMRDAERGGIAGRGPWKQYPGRMLMWRAFWLAARDIYADVLSGLQGAEELEDLQHEIAAQKKPTRPPAVERVAAAFAKAKPVVVAIEDADDEVMKVVVATDEVPQPSADTKDARFAEAKTVGLSGKTKAELVAMIGKLKESIGLSMESFINVAQDAGVNYSGGDPTVLSSQSLKGLHAALKAHESIPF